MISPLRGGPLITLEEVGSTQDAAAEMLRKGESIGAVLAMHQTRGRGRLGRAWLSGHGDSLTASLVFSSHADHPSPHLVGMSVAIAAAGAIHARLRWPNDLVFGERKVGGILTEIVGDSTGRRVPVVGLGINLNQEAFPDEIREVATSLRLQRGGGQFDPAKVLSDVVERLELLPDPDSWRSIEAAWLLFDSTPGKTYRLHDGREAIALGIGPDGQLLCAVDGESTSVMAADAILG